MKARLLKRTCCGLQHQHHSSSISLPPFPPPFPLVCSIPHSSCIVHAVLNRRESRGSSRATRLCFHYQLLCFLPASSMNQHQKILQVSGDTETPYVSYVFKKICRRYISFFFTDAFPFLLKKLYFSQKNILSRLCRWDCCFVIVRQDKEYRRDWGVVRSCRLLCRMERVIYL